ERRTDRKFLPSRVGKQHAARSLRANDVTSKRPRNASPCLAHYGKRLGAGALELDRDAVLVEDLMGLAQDRKGAANLDADIGQEQVQRGVGRQRLAHVLKKLGPGDVPGFLDVGCRAVRYSAHGLVGRI